MKKKPKISFTIDQKGELIVECEINWESPNIIQELGMLLSYILFTENMDALLSILERSAESSNKSEDFGKLIQQLQNIESNIVDHNQDNSIVPPTKSPWFFT